MSGIYQNFQATDEVKQKVKGLMRMDTQELSDIEGVCCESDFNAGLYFKSEVDYILLMKEKSENGK